MKVVWMGPARAELRGIGGYLERPRTAMRIIRAIRVRVRLLGRFPFSGRMIPEIGDPALREVIVGQFRVLHRVCGNRVEILHVVDGRQLFSPTGLSEAEAVYGSNLGMTV